ncbi:MAG: hypothetical protein D6738_12545 [Acidobacteria bacterium]|nr:MAG: hypothetical protein D6738_12545 [Acidobacteriota bacterium]
MVPTGSGTSARPSSPSRRGGLSPRRWPTTRSYRSPDLRSTVIDSVGASAPASASLTAFSTVEGAGSRDRARHQASAFCRA